MAGPQLCPFANHTAQWFATRYPGDTMEVNTGVLHTTEGTGWPGYEQGAKAPHFTGKPNFTTKRIEWRQHYPVDRSSRALRNLAGGVETNTRDTLQIELIGTCDLATSRNWSLPHIFWPEAPDWALMDVARLMAWLRTEHDIPLTSGLTFYGYPGSYANGRGQRLSFTAWNNFRGWCGHQHVPEQVHGDPGSLDVPRLLAMARAIVNPTITPSPEEDDMPNLSQMTVPQPYGDETRTGTRRADLVLSEAARYGFAAAQAVDKLAGAFAAYVTAEKGADSDLTKLVQTAADQITAEVSAIGTDLDALSEHLGNGPVA